MRQNFVNALSAAGLSATFVGNGIGRFAYIALMPALIQAGWFSKSEASYLGVATLAGYLLGAPLADRLARRFSVGTLIRGALLVCSISYLACAIQDASLAWFYLWRTLAGAGGAILMVLAAPAVLACHSKTIRGKVSGVVFSGIGLGAAASGTLIPLLVSHSLSAAWLGMGIVCLALTVLTWPSWAAESERPASGNSTSGTIPSGDGPLSRQARIAVSLILAAYVLNAIGYLPHTLFWVDYIVRELNMPLAAGGFFWAVFGLGAAMGPMVTGFVGDIFGFRRCLMICFLLKALGVALPLISSTPAALFFSSLLVGAFTPGIVTLVSSYTLDFVGPSRHRKAWGMMTFSFAASQAVVGYLMAYVVSDMSSYRPLFIVSALALVVSSACVTLTRAQATPAVADRAIA